MGTKILYIILFISSICFGQISRNPQFVQFLQYDTSYTVTGQEPIGTRYWDEAEGTTSLVLDNGVILQDGQEVYYPVINQTGGELENGKVAHYDGTNGNSGTLKVDYSVASKTSVIPYFLGVITETIPNGGTGKVTRFGKVRGIQTNGADYGETWEDGDVLYVSTTNQGGMTNVMPTAPNPAIKIGWVISAHGTNGTIFVNPSYPDRLEDLADVDGKPLANTGQVPVWNNASEYFDFTHRIETTLAKTDTSLTTGKGIADYVKKSVDSLNTLNKLTNVAYKGQANNFGSFTQTASVFNSASAIQLNGTSVNTTGTLSNVAYKGQNNAFTLGQSMASPLTLTSTTNLITTNTRDTSDNALIGIGGGGGTSNTRGASLFLYGNEHASTGGVIITSGNVAGSFLSIRHRGTERIGVLGDSPNDVVITGNIKASGTITGTNHIAGSADFFYFGDPTTDGSWRIGRSGNNLVFERRESGSWVTKQTITP